MLHLVKFSKDWCDEFQAEGLVILNDVELAQLNQLIEEGQFDFYFGTNEGWDSGEIDETDFTITPISEQEADTLKYLIPELKTGAFGQIMDSDFIEEAILNTTE